MIFEGNPKLQITAAIGAFGVLLAGVGNGTGAAKVGILITVIGFLSFMICCWIDENNRP